MTTRRADFCSVQTADQPGRLERRLPYWSNELFLADEEAWPHRRRLKVDVRGTEVSIDGRFVAAVLTYVLLTVLVAMLGGSPLWTAVLIGNGSGLLGLVLHEIGHAAATRTRGHCVRWVALSAPSSAAGNFARGERYSPQTLACVAFAGPAVNILSAMVLVVAWSFTQGYVSDALLTAAIVNGAGLLNLWPGRARSPAGKRKVLTDGGLIVRAFRAARTGVIPD